MGGYTRVMHGRSRMIIDPRSHPCHVGTEHVGFSPTRQTLLAPGAKRVGWGVSCQQKRLEHGAGLWASSASCVPRAGCNPYLACAGCPRLTRLPTLAYGTSPMVRCYEYNYTPTLTPAVGVPYLSCCISGFSQDGIHVHLVGRVAITPYVPPPCCILYLVPGTTLSVITGDHSK